MSKTTRREFVKTGAAASLALPVLNHTAMGTSIVRQLMDEAAGDGRVLLIVELAGGNDGLNTIVPLRQYGTYSSLRTRIAIPRDQVLPLYGANTDNGAPTMGLTPNFAALQPVFDAGRIAVIQSAHYPNPNLSHDASRRNYYTGVPSTNLATQGAGWIGRHSVLYGDRSNSLDTVGVGGVNKTLYAVGAKASGINASAAAATYGDPTGYQFDATNAGDRNNQIDAAKVIDADPSTKPYFDLWETTAVDAINGSAQVAAAAAAYTSPVVYPANDGFAAGLRLIAKLVTATAQPLGTRVFYISIGGFDTHANQSTDQPILHQRVANGLKAFYDDLVAHNLADRVVIAIWSEFGRRIADNASNGTDHGTSNDMFVIGNAVKGGVYGPDPNLLDLTNGNLKWSVDFRSVYAELISKWMGGDPVAVLGGSFPALGFL
jgi:uncharacterized protein (DUF1501 family)